MRSGVPSTKQATACNAIMLPRLTARTLLNECTGRDIWSVDYCLEKRVPQEWIDELTDGFESGFRTDRQTIYYEEKVVNQFQGVRDIDLAKKLAALLGVNVEFVIGTAFSPEAQVRALQEAVDE